MCVCVYLCIEKLIVGKFTPELNPLLNIFTTFIYAIVLHRIMIKVHLRRDFVKFLECELHSNWGLNTLISILFENLIKIYIEERWQIDKANGNCFMSDSIRLSVVVRHRKTMIKEDFSINLPLWNVVKRMKIIWINPNNILWYVNVCWLSFELNPHEILFNVAQKK